MIDIQDKSQCTGCTACAAICPHKVIKMGYDECGHLYPYVNVPLCTDCGLCDMVCPLLHTDTLPNDDNIDKLKVFAVYNKDNYIRRQSTSGGFFSVIAEYIISIGGVVVAARFDNSFHIIHSVASKVDDLASFRGSKYAESDLGDIFLEIKKILKDKTVLFVGTPCQVAGLKSYLIKKHDNLILCDFVCMGISSPKIWEEYLDSYWDRKTIKKIFFKDKRVGWHKSDWRMLIEDEGGEHLMKGMYDPFFYGYLTHLTFRPACFDCKFRNCNRVSDFTIADCWGIDKVNPSFDDNKGCTTLILQNDKSKALFEKIKDRLNVVDFSIHDVVTYNPFIKNKVSPHPDGEEFYKMYIEKGFKVATEQYCVHKEPSIIERIIKRIIRIF